MYAILKKQFKWIDSVECIYLAIGHILVVYD